MTAIDASTSLAERADCLKRVLRGRNSVDLALFRFAGLQLLAELDGQAWPRRRDLLWQIAKIYLVNRIEEDDILVSGAEGFVVMFADRASMKADFAAQGLAEGASDRFQGLTDGPSPELVAETVRISAARVAKIVREHGSGAEPGRAPGFRAPTEVDLLFQPSWEARREQITNLFPHRPFAGAPVGDRGGSFEPGQDEEIEVCSLGCENICEAVDRHGG